jgi:hypothetical protein|tara:strand:- start:239 stop:469 length:231 start_codon:yes stop_codon:yes gene_type:complete
MGVDFKACRVNWLNRDELELKIRDISRKVLYKTRVDLNNEKKLAEALSVLEKYGVDMQKMADIIKSKKKEVWSWFN